MDTPTTPIYGADTERRRQAFLVCAAGLALRHDRYLLEEGKTIEECYALELTEYGSRIEIHRDVPMDIYEEIHTCWKHCFG